LGSYLWVKGFRAVKIIEGERLPDLLFTVFYDL
jgi:hypothetical protein